MEIKFDYDYPDNGKLYKAWEKYYNKIGLSYNKKMKKVFERVSKGKYPIS